MFHKVDDLLSDCYERAVASHGDVGVDAHAFHRHLQSIVERHVGPAAGEDKITTFIEGLNTNDLLLSLACAHGTEAGWQRFAVLYRRYVADLSRCLLHRGSDPEELAENVWIDLFLPDRSGRSRIASYDGRSSLATWLRVVVSNRIINERQRRGFRTNTLDSVPEPVDARALETVEARVDGERFKSMIIRCFEVASRRLTAQERIIVLLRYEHGLRLGEIARLFCVHQSTITRQIDRAVERLRGDIVDLLASEYSLDRSAIDECFAVADSPANAVSILAVLKTSLPGEDHTWQDLVEGGNRRLLNSSAL